MQLHCHPELGRRPPLPHHLQEALQLVPLVTDALGEVLADEDAAPLQELGLPQDLLFILHGQFNCHDFFPLHFRYSSIIIKGVY